MKASKDQLSKVLDIHFLDHETQQIGGRGGRVMTIVRFFDDDGKQLLEYRPFISMDEIEATVGLLEYENNCKVTYKILERIDQVERS